MNKVILIGRLTRDVEMRYTQNSSTAIANYTLAVNRPYKQNGEQEADFLRCTAFGKMAELAEKYLAKGMRVAVEGRIQTGSYTNRDGQKVYTTDIMVERQEFLEKRGSDSQSDAGTAGDYQADGYINIPDGIDEDLPFN